jgi:hypothetical protein
MIRVPARALTLTIPWGYAFRELGKNIENRTWRPPDALLGQPIAIHAGKAPTGKKAWAEVSAAFDAIEGATGTHLPPITGDLLRAQSAAIVVVGTLAGWFVNESTWKTADGMPPRISEIAPPWKSEGSYGWIIRDRMILPTPVPSKGAQGLWTIPFGVKKAIEDQLIIVANAQREAARG